MWVMGWMMVLGLRFRDYRLDLYQIVDYLSWIALEENLERFYYWMSQLMGMMWIDFAKVPRMKEWNERWRLLVGRIYHYD